VNPSEPRVTNAAAAELLTNLAALDTGRFAGCRRAWTETLATMAPGRVIAIDGKTLCNSFDVATGKQALHLVSAWAAEQRLTLGQVATDAKSNEIEALPRVLDLLDLDGAVVTVGCAGLPDRGQGRRYGVAAPALRRRPR
jgi:hypothetical protein